MTKMTTCTHVLCTREKRERDYAGVRSLVNARRRGGGHEGRAAARGRGGRRGAGGEGDARGMAANALWRALAVGAVVDAVRSGRQVQVAGAIRDGDAGARAIVSV